MTSASAEVTVEWLDRGPEPEVAAALRRCCASTAWVAGLLAARPFASCEGLLRVAEDLWWSLGPEDWLEAFSGHPRIGDLEGLRVRFASTHSWASGEQAGMADAGDDVLRGFADANRKFEETFGHLFIVCATGKSAPEMLELLEERLLLSPEKELRVAAGEQQKITSLRLRKLLGLDTEGRTRS